MKKVAASSLASEFPQMVVDESAETFLELLAKSPMGRGWLHTFIHDKVASGEWEQVWKHRGPRLIEAYRRRK